MEELIIIPARDQEKIYTTVYYPQRPNGSSIVIGAAVAVSRLFYKHFARSLAGEGYVVYTFDYRGIGQSRPRLLSGYKASMHQWGTLDLDAVLLHAHRAFPGNELIYIGHSIGGQILGLARASQYVSKIILVASQLPYWRLWPARHQLRLWFQSHLALPGLSFLFGFFPGKHLGLTMNLPAGVAREWGRWLRSPEGLFSYFPDYNYRKLKAPMLIYSFDDDPIAPRTAVEALKCYYPNASIQHRHIVPQDLGKDRIGHFLFFRMEGLWPGLLEWLKNSGRRRRALTIRPRQAEEEGGRGE